MKRVSKFLHEWTELRSLSAGTNNCIFVHNSWEIYNIHIADNLSLLDCYTNMMVYLYLFLSDVLHNIIILKCVLFMQARQ